MLKLLKTNIIANLKFYGRNKLFISISILILIFLLLLISSPSASLSSNRLFGLLISIIETFNFYFLILIGILALISIWYHKKNKTVKLIFTKPCTPEIWVLSHYISIALLHIIFLLGSFFIYVFASYYWGLPFQAGIFVLLAYYFLLGIIIYSYLLFLSTWLHPVMAGFFAISFMDKIFFFIARECYSEFNKSEDVISSMFLLIGKWISLFLYYIIPGCFVFNDEFNDVFNSLRFEFKYIGYLLDMAIYALALFVLSYLLTTYKLRKTRFN